MKGDRTELRRLKEATWESDEAYRILAETASDAIVTIDAASTILVVNPRAGELFGYDASEMIGSSLTTLIPDYLRRLHCASVARYTKAGPQHISWASVECTGLHRSGRELSLEVSFGEFTREGKHCLTGIIRDISTRKRAEKRLAAQHAVTRILAASDSLRQAAPQILQTLCEHLCWELGALWGVEREEGVLRVVEIWHAPDISVEGFEKHSKETSLEVGVGLPGRVWQNSAPVWLIDVRADENFPRVREAAEAGLCAAFAFPVTLGSEVLGVIEFFSREMREPDAELLAMVASVGSQTGQFIERKSAQDALRKSNEELERAVAERTAKLVETNARLKKEVAERRQAEESLQQSARDYRMLFEQAHDAIVIFVPEQEIVLDVNKRACEIYGYSRAEFIGMSIEVISKDVARGNLRIAETLEKGDYLNFETIQYRKDGTEIFLEINAAVINYRGVRAILSINRDITERKRAEEALRLSEERFAKAFYSNPEPISITRQSDSTILEINDRWESVFGYTREEVIGRTAAELDLYVNDKDRQKLKALFYEQGFLRQQEAICRGKYGDVCHVSMSAEPIVINDEPCIIFLMRDITERKRAEEERAQLLHRLVAAQEDERRRIALELHDHVGQFSTALMLGLKSLKNSSALPPDSGEPIEQLMHLTGQFGQEMHHLAWELRPSSLDDHGLQAALASYIEEWSARSEVAVDFHSSGLEERRLPAQIETVVYRVVQEALTNVAKHAGARRVGVVMECRPRCVRIIVEDDGRGFDAGEVLKSPETQRRMGLVGMHERARMVGGEIEIEASPGKGTTIFLSIPIAPGEGE